jgi:hypothetical protein
MLSLMRILITIVCFFLALSLSAEIYRSIDVNGSVVFEDTPSPDAELIEVDELQTIQPPPVEDFKYTPKEKPIDRYKTLDITSPQHDSTIRDNSGNVIVNLSVSPKLAYADNLVLYLDGKEVVLGKSTAKSFTEIDRGTHQLRAVVKDDEGHIQINSSSVTFHLLRQSVVNRARRN